MPTFRCNVKTAKGEPDFEADIVAPSLTAASNIAKTQARENGYTPEGRVRGAKLKD